MPSTGPSTVVTGAACAPAASPHSNASVNPNLRISPFPSVGVLALNIADDLPDLVRGQLVLPGRHPARRAFRDGVKDLARLAAILPAVVGEVGAHATGEIVSMTARAVHLAEQGMARFRRLRLAGQGIGRIGRDLCNGRRCEERQNKSKNLHQYAA